ncbi:hypothetical protein JW905_15370 [bacterium]|nr:hypothetical protein [candidate division CSSED10-310 bacterium]
MRSYVICLALWLLPAGFAAASTITLTNPDTAACEDYYGFLCVANNDYDALVAWVDLYGSIVSEGTKVSFALPTLPVGTIITAVQFSYFGTGDPGGGGYGVSGPMTIKSYTPPGCVPMCGAAGSACSACQTGSVYISTTVAGGLHTMYLTAALAHLQAAFNNGDDCFGLCLAPGSAADYEVALSALALIIDYQLPTPTPTVTPTVTVTPTATLTPTPAPIPAVAGPGILLLVLFMSGILLERRLTTL